MTTPTTKGSRSWKPYVGLATAAATVATGAAPVANAAPTQGDDASTTRQAADETTRSSGAYESCSAYFGFGKGNGFADIVSFDVVDDNGSDGVDHAVPTDTEVVFHITTEGGTITCAPAEVTQAEWDASMEETREFTYLQNTPAWPGPGHYAYPSIVWEPWIEDFGEVTGVTFEVVGVPGEHTLVSPVGVTPLVQNHMLGIDFTGVLDPRVRDFVATEVGEAAAVALEEGTACDDEPITFTQDTLDALNAIASSMGADPIDLVEDIDCGLVMYLPLDKSLDLAFADTIAYTETIHLQVAEDPATTTSTTAAAAATTPTTPTPAQVARPVAASPRYTG